jgi:hypothetical protein
VLSNDRKYAGHFSEKQFDFFESFKSVSNLSYYSELPFLIKFGGVQSIKEDTNKEEFNWLRQPENLTAAFNTFYSIGLDKFVSLEKFNKKNNEWCCATLWEGLSLKDIVNAFLQADTALISSNYYSKFWQRRKREGNLLETFEILQLIHQFYNKNNTLNDSSAQIIPVLKELLSQDLKLINSDSTEYYRNAIRYFDKLKSYGLNYSAYLLIFDNYRLEYQSSELKDSLLSTLKQDTLTGSEFKLMNSNYQGWIQSENFPTPNQELKY